MQLSEFLDSVMHDVRYAARGLIRRPGLTAVAVLTLAIGVGATTAIFSAVNALLLRPLPYARPNELMRLPLFIPADGALAKSESGWSYPMFSMLRDEQKSFTDIAPYTFGQFNLTSGDVERVAGEYVGASYLHVLGLFPVRGRDFDGALDAHTTGAPHEVILSYGLWQRRFNGDPSIVGRTIDINREPWTIIGVGPKDFRGLSGQADLLLPAATMSPARLSANYFNFVLIARRAPTVTVAQAVAATTAIGARVGAAYPNPMSKLNWEVGATPLDEARIDPAIKRSLLVLFGAVCLVLGMACVNVANLLLGRATARRSEIAVRMAMGAGRARLVRLLLTESVLLAFAGAIASVAVAWLGVRALSTIDPAAVGRASNVAAAAFGAVQFSSIALDLRALSFTLVASLVVGVLFGLAPALDAARASLTGALNSDRRSSSGGAGRRALVVAEVALAIVLLAGSGLMVRSLAKLLSTDVGFNAANVLTFQLTAPPGSVPRDSMPGFYSQILDRVRAVPGVSDVALGSCAPLTGRPCSGGFFHRAGTPLSGPADMNTLIGTTVVSPNWFSLMRVPLERGRTFTTADGENAPQVMLLNESAVKKFFGSEDPMGKHVSLGGFAGITDAEVIGIVGGVRQRADSAPEPTAYVSIAQSPSPGITFFVRSSRDDASLGTEVRRAVHDVAPQLPLYGMQTMTQITAAATEDARFRTLLLSVFGLMALSLAAIGIYGVLSFAVASRTREIGIRIALGAERARVQRLVIGEGIGLVAVGAIVGVAGALAATRLLRTFLFELTPNDPLTYLMVVVVLGLVAVVSSWVPALRASRVDPVVALRAE